MRSACPRLRCYGADATGLCSAQARMDDVAGLPHNAQPSDGNVTFITDDWRAQMISIRVPKGAHPAPCLFGTGSSVPKGPGTLPGKRPAGALAFTPASAA